MSILNRRSFIEFSLVSLFDITFHASLLFLFYMWHFTICREKPHEIFTAKMSLCILNHLCSTLLHFWLLLEIGLKICAPFFLCLLLSHFFFQPLTYIEFPIFCEKRLCEKSISAEFASVPFQALPDESDTPCWSCWNEHERLYSIPLKKFGFPLKKIVNWIGCVCVCESTARLFLSFINWFLPNVQTWKVAHIEVFFQESTSQEAKPDCITQGLWTPFWRWTRCNFWRYLTAKSELSKKFMLSSKRWKLKIKIHKPSDSLALLFGWEEVYLVFCLLPHEKCSLSGLFIILESCGCQKPQIIRQMCYLTTKKAHFSI